ncbi:DUF563 domain-containing protein [Pseudoalteromonas sp. SR41-7]|uniref:glycosyltransferase family 61 protein n=1 Tax=Pseudoalteromonas sp. SR41-7 TaxID=2760947 RepID=UPI001602103D|nr:glycosyltransferase family 61 protein [Pseudoalteromonas sp. SR41-7]MBB1298295.1 glycosyltransferase family 61 protein [Pseudoalteromonas sp. SR41-7]
MKTKCWKDYVTILNRANTFTPSYFNKQINDLSLNINIIDSAKSVRSELDLKSRTMPINIYDCAGNLVESSHHFRGPKHDFFKYDKNTELDLSNNYTKIEGDTIYLGWLIPHYGHFLMETLSRCWVLELLEKKSNYKFLFNYYNKGNDFIKDKKWAKEFLLSFGIHEEDIIFAEKNFYFEKLIIPSQSLILHSSVNVKSQKYIWHKIKSFFKPEGLRNDRKVYLSRKLLKKEKRRLANEDKVEAIFSKFGFEIIYPETLSLKEQVNLLHNSKIVVGPSGSALHNAAFMQEGSLLISLTTPEFCLLNEVLCCFSAKTQYELFFGESSDDGAGLWTIDCDELDLMLRGHVFINS